MSREQFFKPSNQEGPKAEEPAGPEKLADWEMAKAKHLEAKEEFHKARAAASRTGKEKYLDNKHRKQIKTPEKLSM